VNEPEEDALDLGEAAAPARADESEAVEREEADPTDSGEYGPARGNTAVAPQPAIRRDPEPLSAWVEAHGAFERPEATAPPTRRARPRSGRTKDATDTWYDEFVITSYDSVKARVKAACYDEDLATEATDEAFMRCYKDRARVRHFACAEGWALRVAMHRLYDIFRRKRVFVEKVEWRLAPCTNDYAADLYADVLDVEKAVANLPRRQREVMRLTMLGMTPTEIADVLGIEPNNASSNLAAGRRTLRKVLGHEGGMQ
jgi:RNA polymerase sigma factor (sigma-70 family)